MFKRLLNRDQNDKKIANERMKQFRKDVLHWKNYDFIVINDELENCYNKIKSYLDAKKINFKHLGHNKEFIQNHIQNLLN